MLLPNGNDVGLVYSAAGCRPTAWLRLVVEVWHPDRGFQSDGSGGDDHQQTDRQSELAEPLDHADLPNSAKGELGEIVATGRIV